VPQAAALKNDYANPDNWLCRPGLAKEKDACAVDLSTTVIAADGKTTLEPFTADPVAPIDCFYVYPTVSNDPGGNATMQAETEEKAAIRINSRGSRPNADCTLRFIANRR
jgi:hypothetical protein